MKFILYFLDGKTQIIEGETIDKAFTAAGYGNGALRAVDWYAEYDEKIGLTHRFDKVSQSWVRLKPIIEVPTVDVS